MKTIIFDENMPVNFRLAFPEYVVVTVRYLGWCGIKNGELVGLVDGKFDILLTADKNLRYQQNLRDRKVAIVEVPTNDIDRLMEMAGRISEIFNEAKPGDYKVVS